MAAYDDYDYSRYWISRKYEHLSEVAVLKDFFATIGRNKRIIDIGGGYGRLAKEYSKYAKSITIAEPSLSLLNKAKKYLSGIASNLKYVNSPLEKLDTTTIHNNYDVAVLVRVIHHIESPKTAIVVASKALDKGGYFILEFANKIHGKAIFKNFLNGNFTFPLEIFPADKRSSKNKKVNSILFLNHHPDVIYDELRKHGFKIIKKRSVSNIRNKFLKEKLPMSVLIIVEKFLQKPLAKINFGPSIFILAKKK